MLISIIPHSKLFPQLCDFIQYDFLIILYLTDSTFYPLWLFRNEPLLIKLDLSESDQIVDFQEWELFVLLS